MLRNLTTAGLAIVAASAAWGQTPDPSLTFEVATIKPSAPPASMDGRKTMIRVGSQGGPGSSDPGQLTYSFATLRMLVTQAYSLKNYQVTGPEWLDSEHFDVVAKVPKGATKDDVKIMLRNLLKERFHMAFHNEKKDLPVYALVVAKNGPKMKESADQSDPNEKAAVPATGDGAPTSAPPPPADPGRMKMGSDGMPVMPSARPGNLSNMVMMSPAGARAKLTGTQVTVTQLVGNLSNQVDRPLIDATNLTKRYDITLDFAPDVSTMNAKMGMSGMMAGPPPGGGGGRGPDAGPGGPPLGEPQVDSASLPAALQEQLGLKLEQRKAPVELLVVDKVDKAPTEN